MQTATGILIHTPIWVFALLAYLVWQGSRSLQPRTQPLWLIVPVMFFLMGLSRLVLARNNGWELLLAWFVAAFLFASLALYRGPGRLAIDRKNGLVTRPGSPMPLLRNVTVFLLQICHRGHSRDASGWPYRRSGNRPRDIRCDRRLLRGADRVLAA
jgi:hypothetical protein